LLLDNLALDGVEEWRFGLWLKVVVCTLLLLNQVLLCLSKVLRAVECGEPVIGLRGVLFLDLK